MQINHELLPKFTRPSNTIKPKPPTRSSPSHLQNHTLLSIPFHTLTTLFRLTLHPRRSRRNWYPHRSLAEDRSSPETHITVSEKTTGVTTELANLCVSDNHSRAFGFSIFTCAFLPEIATQPLLIDEEFKNQVRVD
ncbi:uncharacterized protein LOC110902831 [Helianthus annuus]|uniref:uncharacterized protein LOC110902831 n=1 Tax=Helianthus annuus TaxID=4232 RepID=UPI000B8FE9FD|nr:uncharacterized protein LOC110902831 [Helianthus annuus]